MGPRISLSRELREQFELKRPEFLVWIEQQRQANNDSLHWWMSHLAGRNNAASLLFLYICHIAALKNWIGSQANPPAQVLVVCEDAFLLSALQSNLGSELEMRRHPSALLGIIWSGANALLRAGYVWSCEIYRCFQHARAARKSRTRPTVRPRGHAVLIHQCLDDKAFRADGALVDRYFGVLPAWLDQHDRNVFRLPWLCNVRQPLSNVYQFLRRHKVVVPEDFLTLTDYVVSFWHHLRTVFTRMESQLAGLQIGALVLRERFEQFAAVNLVRFWFYGPALKSWGRELNHLTLIDTYEGMPPEHVQAVTLKKQMPSVRYLGYCHSLVSRDFLAYWSLPGEWLSVVAPDTVVTNGRIGRTALMDQGAPDQRLVSGPALRQQLCEDIPDTSRSGLLVLLTIDPDASCETLLKLSQCGDLLRRLGIPVRVKPHPMMRREKILPLLGWSDLPTGWVWGEGEIYEELTTAHCCVALYTAGVYDAVLAGCVVLSIARELGVMGNYLDLFQEEFPVLRAIQEEDIPDRLREMFGTRKAEYRADFRTLRQHLLDGLGPVNDDTLHAFLMLTSDGSQMSKDHMT